ncbi:hypothetical protein BO70DRAFT_367036 [Aspergillus heteromorphus CBS 117.55]|uniref:Uncharacterized protein n=1 Tax=Aspergillus heteromorphus CBS 117.55 TaxID=1448321 RepID=A0A317UUN7_9EURO|nr:uncharacterized protein BO70DRAFT_367036 [Aspergillus heteromorphus CBS 117.55]PWY64257.1 hypothetical protein BO70DRAFT_367036 [Aspergillus heteromorphus CBS 117.55]
MPYVGVIKLISKLQGWKLIRHHLQTADISGDMEKKCPCKIPFLTASDICLIHGIGVTIALTY